MEEGNPKAGVKKRRPRYFAPPPPPPLVSNLEPLPFPFNAGNFTSVDHEASTGPLSEKECDPPSEFPSYLRFANEAAPRFDIGSARLPHFAPSPLLSTP